jgi:hypothetical protein
MKNKILRWLANGETGMSSETMAYTAIGIKTHKSHPYDPADLNRCLVLVKKVPEIKKHFGKIAKISKQWKAVIDNWTLLEMTFVTEVGWNWSKSMAAPKTYELMKKLGL